jgi:hypothetical protein
MNSKAIFAGKTVRKHLAYTSKIYSHENKNAIPFMQDGILFINKIALR